MNLGSCYVIAFIEIGHTGIVNSEQDRLGHMGSCLFNLKFALAVGQGGFLGGST